MPPEDEEKPSVLRKVGKAILYFIFFAVAIPLLLGWIFGVPAASILSLIAAALLLQAGAPAFASVFGLNPPAVVITMACFALGMVLAIREACESLALSSAKVSNWIGNMQKKTEKYPQIEKYGPISCTLIAWIPGIGLYGTPIISWILQWKKITSTAFTVLGFVIASIFVLFFMSYLSAFIEIFVIAGMIGVVVFAVTSMLSMVFTFTMAEILASLKDRRFVVLSLAGNFVLAPLTAWVITRIPGLPGNYATGLLIMACAGGATFLLKYTKGAKGNTDRVGGLMVLPSLVTIAFMPLVLPLFSPAAFPGPVQVALPLVVLLLVPLLLALFARSRYEEATTRRAPLVTKISAIGFGAVLVGFLGAVIFGLLIGEAQLNPGLFLSWAFFAAILFLLVAFGIGYFLGGPGGADRRALGMGTGLRNLAAATVVAGLCFLQPSGGRILHSAPNPDIITMVVVTGLIGIILFNYLGKYLAKKAA